MDTQRSLVELDGDSHSVQQRIHAQFEQVLGSELCSITTEGLVLDREWKDVPASRITPTLLEHLLYPACERSHVDGQHGVVDFTTLARSWLWCDDSEWDHVIQRDRFVVAVQDLDVPSLAEVGQHTRNTPATVSDTGQGFFLHVVDDVWVEQQGLVVLDRLDDLPACPLQVEQVAFPQQIAVVIRDTPDVAHVVGVRVPQDVHLVG